MSSKALTIANVSPLEIRRDSVKYPRLHQYEKEDAIARLSDIVINAYLYTGRRADTAEVRFIASALYDELLSEDKYHAKYITLEEIERAVKKALFGDKDLFISVVSLYKAIMDWIKVDGHQLDTQVRQMERDENAKALKESIIAGIVGENAQNFIINNKI